MCQSLSLSLALPLSPSPSPSPPLRLCTYTISLLYFDLNVYHSFHLKFGRMKADVCDGSLTWYWENQTVQTVLQPVVCT